MQRDDVCSCDEEMEACITSTNEINKSLTLFYYRKYIKIEEFNYRLLRCRM